MRRCTDPFCYIAGIILILLGIFLFIFPEISYRSSQGDEPLQLHSTGRRTVAVPMFTSVLIFATGAGIFFNAAKIKMRGGNG